MNFFRVQLRFNRRSAVVLAARIDGANDDPRRPVNFNTLGNSDVEIPRFARDAVQLKKRAMPPVLHSNAGGSAALSA